MGQEAKGNQGMKVDLIDSMGSDLSVVNAARVSFDKQSEWENVERKIVCDNTLFGELETTITDKALSEKDKKLIRYLSDHNHWSPFAHCFASFRIKAPIFVARQLQKHTVGLAWNEVSRRYVDSDPEFYTPTSWRKRADNVKQGSSDEVITKSPMGLLLEHHYEGHIQICMDRYQILLRSGVCPEQARMVLPQSMMTEWIWSGSLYAFARVCKLRLDPHTQKETQEIAQLIADHMSDLFPVSWSALCTP